MSLLCSSRGLLVHGSDRNPLLSRPFDPQTEAEIREQKLDALQDRVLELKDRARLQQTPVQMQVSPPPKGRGKGSLLGNTELTLS